MPCAKSNLQSERTFETPCTLKRCDKFKLKRTSHGGMYTAHNVVEISITLKQ